MNILERSEILTDLAVLHGLFKKLSREAVVGIDNRAIQITEEFFDEVTKSEYIEINHRYEGGTVAYSAVTQNGVSICALYPAGKQPTNFKKHNPEEEMKDEVFRKETI